MKPYGAELKRAEAAGEAKGRADEKAVWEAERLQLIEHFTGATLADHAQPSLGSSPRVLGNGNINGGMDENALGIGAGVNGIVIGNTIAHTQLAAAVLTATRGELQQAVLAHHEKAATLEHENGKFGSFLLVVFAVILAFFVTGDTAAHVEGYHRRF
jgi:hypothetical protein